MRFRKRPPSLYRYTEKEKARERERERERSNNKKAKDAGNVDDLGLLGMAVVYKI